MTGGVTSDDDKGWGIKNQDSSIKLSTKTQHNGPGGWFFCQNDNALVTGAIPKISGAGFILNGTVSRAGSSFWLVGTGVGSCLNTILRGVSPAQCHCRCGLHSTGFNGYSFLKRWVIIVTELSRPNFGHNSPPLEGFLFCTRGISYFLLPFCGDGCEGVCSARG